MTFAILGSLEVVRDGARIEPDSPKVRTLLVDLLLHHGQARSTDRLIDDLWGDRPPGTAAGVLQNYVSQLRKLVGADSVRHSNAGYVLEIAEGQLDRDRFVGLVDAAQASAALEVKVARAREALALWRGEALADVAEADFAQAEIARLSELRAAANELLFEAELARGNHRETVPALEAALVQHPLRERLWALLMTALYRSCRQADALHAYQRARQLLIEELGVEPGPELRELEQAVLRQDPGLTLAPASRGRRRATAEGTPLAGRGAERGAIDEFMAQPTGMLLLSGEAGIGKTRLLEEAQDRHRGVVLAARAYEAERGRPYGPWTDALRGCSLPVLPDALRDALAPLMPELGVTSAAVEDTARLYDGIVALLTQLAAHAAVLVVLDDVQWLDERSVALLHFAVRNLGTQVAFLTAARPRELADNGACRRALEAVRREHLMQELSIGPLPSDAIGALAHDLAPRADLDAIVSASNGNPLLAIEMARAVARGDHPFTTRVDALIGDRLAQLSEAAAALVPVLATSGRSTKPSVLAAATGLAQEDLVAPLAELEEHGVLVPGDDGTYDFAHDLVRDAAYRRLSTPRRAMLHGRLGRALNTSPDPDDMLAAEAARHAHAADDSTTCASASLRAARRCVRLLAFDDAEAHVDLGRAHARRLELHDRIAYDVRLIDVLLHPALRLHRPGTLGAELAELCALAQQLQLSEELTTGLTLLGRVHHWGWGDIPRAGALLQRALDVIEASGTPVAEPLLQGARCLAYLEMDMPRARDLFAQLSGLGPLAEASHQYQWGRGLVLAWAGNLPGARRALQEASSLAQRRHDHWAAFECTARLALLEIEAGNHTGDLLDQLDEFAERLGPSGSEAAYARAIRALATDQPSLIDRIEELLAVNARMLVPDLLGLASEAQFRAGDLDSAETLAAQALQIATSVHRTSEQARAHGLLACIAAQRGQRRRTAEHLAARRDTSEQWSQHVRSLYDEAQNLIGRRTEESWQ